MPVAFCGIKHLNTTTKKQNQVGSYRTPEGDIKTGRKNVTYINISYNVSDDKTGKDHDNYINALSKSNKFDCLNPNFPNTVDFQVKIDNIGEDKKVSFRNVCFKLNDKPIAFNTDNDLPLFQYLAFMTRERLKEYPQTTNFDRQCLDMANDAIAEAASEYFDV